MSASQRRYASLPFASCLRRREVARFPHPRQLCLRVQRGTLWVTVDGEPDDIELDAGAGRVFNAGTVRVTALGGDAEFTATTLSPPLASWRARLVAWLRGPAAEVVEA